MKPFMIGLVCLLLSSTAFSQWTLINETDNWAEDTCFLCGFAMAKFFNADTGIAFGVKARKPIVSTKWITYDGGSSWRETTLSSPGHSYVDAITDLDHYWWASTNANPGLRTSDGGLTYQELPPYQFYGDASLYFVDSLLGFAGARRMEMYRTTNGGLSWLQVHDSTVHTGYNMRWIAFNSPSAGIAATEEIATWVLRTADSGKTWSSPTTPSYPVASRSYGISWPTPTAAYIITSSRLVHSADSGLTWRSVGSELSQMQARGLSFYDSLNGIVVGYPHPDEGFERVVAALTSDGGASWRRFAFDSMSVLSTTAHFPSPNVAYVKGRTKLYRLDINQLEVDSQPTASEDCFEMQMESDRLVVTFSRQNENRLRVLDLLGRTVWRSQAAGQPEISVDLNDLPPHLIVVIPCNGSYKLHKIAH